MAFLAADLRQQQQQSGDNSDSSRVAGGVRAWSSLAPLRHRNTSPLLPPLFAAATRRTWSSSLQAARSNRNRSKEHSAAGSGGQQQQQPPQGSAIAATTRRRNAKRRGDPTVAAAVVSASATTKPNNNNKKRQGTMENAPTATTVIESQSPPNSSNKPRSIGEAVQQAHTLQDLLQVASQLWLPTDPDLPSHLKTQAIHHEKRQRWSAQLLSKLGDCCVNNEDSRMTLWASDDRLARAVMAAALPFSTTTTETASSTTTTSKNNKERWAIREALLGLHTIVGHTTTTSTQGTAHSGVVHAEFVSGVQILCDRAEAMADDFSLQDAIEVRWAAKGLVARLSSLLVEVAVGQASDNDTEEQNTPQPPHPIMLPSQFPRLDHRARGLPFDILPMGIDFASADWLDHDNDTTAASSQQLANDNDSIMRGLQESIPFRFDTIVTRQGTSVIERRGTAWVAEDGIGALAYSGKLMPPSPMPDLVRAIMRRVETAIDAPGDRFFDCALCNFYPDGDTSCKFHTDPEHGTLWERLNVVVSVGSPRRFAFRPIPDVTTWNEWDGNSEGKSTREPDADSANAPVVIRFFPGDIVQMWGTCNDDFHHAVYPESATTTTALEESQHGDDLSRVSLVLKRAMVNGSRGRRGHGIAGEGRRSRRNKTRP